MCEQVSQFISVILYNYSLIYTNYYLLQLYICINYIFSLIYAILYVLIKMLVDEWLVLLLSPMYTHQELKYVAATLMQCGNKTQLAQSFLTILIFWPRGEGTDIRLHRQGHKYSKLRAKAMETSFIILSERLCGILCSLYKHKHMLQVA